MTLEEFLQPPTAAQWDDALAAGWPGPDGSSWSTDRICGVRIGVTSRDLADAGLPANRHDWRYLLGRTYGLSETFRYAADEGYRDGCIERCRAELKGTRRALLPVALGICWARFYGLRLAARYAWTERARAHQARWTQGGA